MKEEKIIRFKLKHHRWKDKFAIRDLKIENWSISFNHKGWPCFLIDKNPLLITSGITGIRKEGNKDLFRMIGIIPEGKFFNSDKKIKMIVDEIEEGLVNIIEDSENLISIEFKGKLLSGHWIFKRTDSQSNLWLISKGNISPDTIKDNFGIPFSDEELLTIHFLNEKEIGISAISRHLNRPRSSCLHWLSKM